MVASNPKYESNFNIYKLGELQVLRHFVQLACFLFLNGKLIGIGSTLVIVPYLHSTESPFSTAHGAYESLEYTIARGTFPLLVVGIILLTAITVGRVFCGWACPLGMIQDFLSYTPFKKEKLTNETAGQLSDIKKAVIGFSLLTAVLVGFRRLASPLDNPVGVFSDSPFSVISPAGTLFAYIPWLLLWNHNVLGSAGLLVWLKLALMGAALIPGLYVPRFFCRYVCPLGGILEPFSKFKLLRFTFKAQGKVPREEINKTLSDVCPMGVQIGSESTFIDHPGCINCGKCIVEHPREITQTFSL